MIVAFPVPQAIVQQEVTPSARPDSGVASVMSDIFKEYVIERHGCTLSLSRVGQAVTQEIDRIQYETSQPGWDGEGAAAIAVDTARHSKDFLNYLPYNIEDPSLAPEADGHINIEWYKSKSRLVSVSINQAGNVYFLAVLGRGSIVKGSTINPKLAARQVGKLLKDAGF